jgi:cbb3-type cytochrome oxidase cytochrome c subunit
MFHLVLQSAPVKSYSEPSYDWIIHEAVNTKEINDNILANPKVGVSPEPQKCQ